MGKKSDTAKPVTAIAESPASTTKTTTKPAPESAVAVAKPETVTKPEAPPSKPAMDGNGAPPTKTPAKKGAKKTVTFSTKDISLRAYFIAEHRQRLGLHGDSHSDWIEAERQLKKESRKKAAAKKKKAVSKKRA